jgi:hypothetical protein
MGCDFYTYYKICIEYKIGDETKILYDIDEESREKEYFGDGYDGNYIDSCLADYYDDDIFENNEWICEEDEKKKYVEILKAYNIEEKDVIKIWKEGDYQLR